MGQDFWFIIIAILMFAIGSYLVWIGFIKSKKNMSLDEHNNKDGIPIIPRHERSIEETPSVPPSPDADALHSLAAAASSHSGQTAQTQATSENISEPAKPNHKEPSTTQPADSPATNNSEPTKNSDILADDDIVSHELFENTLNQPFEEQSPTLNQHFRHQASERDDQALLSYKDTITIIITPRNTLAGINGSTILKLAKDYAMKYGILKMFHRYESPEGTGQLWFSMLGVSHEGVSGFDLVALPELNYRGLALFLPLPHPQALQGFDSMIAVAQAIATELDADIHDEDNFILDQSHFQAMRSIVASYSNQP